MLNSKFIDVFEEAISADLGLQTTELFHQQLKKIKVLLASCVRVAYRIRIIGKCSLHSDSGLLR